MLRLLQSLKRYQKGHQPLYHYSLVVLFWAVADGVFSFSIPIYMQNSLSSLSLMGLVFASSSAFGLLVDFWLGSEQKGRTFRPYFFVSAGAALLAFLLAFKAQSVWPFLVIMAIWGFYYETMNFGIVDFVNRFSKKWEHAQSAGVVQMFNYLGYFLGPLLVGYLLLDGRKALNIAFFFMLLSLAIFLFYFSRKKIAADPPVKKLSFQKEIKMWQQVGKKTFWVLLGRFLITVWDSLVWSMGPIFLLSIFGNRAALIMTCFILPNVVFQGYAGRWADKKGKKRFVTIGLIIAGLFLLVFSQVTNPLIRIMAALGSGVGASLAWPAIDGLLVDIISSVDGVEEEVAAFRGLSHNLAYIIVPIVAGLLGSYFGLAYTFLLYGAFLVVSAVTISFLWKK